jgi:hypothetical protein
MKGQLKAGYRSGKLHEWKKVVFIVESNYISAKSGALCSDFQSPTISGLRLL